MIAPADGVDIAYDDIGHGPAVVFLHGFPLDRTMWAGQTSAFAGQYRCLAVDTRGFGESADSPLHSMDRYADDVVAVLDAAGVQRATIAGLSMGGYIAFALWRRHSQRVRALVLADTKPGTDSADARDRRLELIDLARRAGPEAVAERQIVGILGKTTRGRRPDVVNMVSAIMSRARVDGIVGALEAMLERPDSAPLLPTISVPTLVVVGDEDVVTPLQEARAMHAAIAGSRLELLAGAGHLSNIERPAAFNAVVSEFLLTLQNTPARPV
jgi:pimeloyl-ACP methyl ester carboxylesterase